MEANQAMNKNPKSFVSRARLGIVLLAAMLSVVSCRRGANDSKPADVDYYTCAMHPSVKSQDPNAKCPICGMDLVPVKKKPAATNETTSGNTNNISDMPAAATNAPDYERPTAFTVPVE